MQVSWVALGLSAVHSFTKDPPRWLNTLTKHFVILPFFNPYASTCFFLFFFHLSLQDVTWWVKAYDYTLCRICIKPSAIWINSFSDSLTFVIHRNALSPFSNHLVDVLQMGNGPVCYQPFKMSALQKRRSLWRREMWRCKKGVYTVCVWGVFPFGRLTFLWCDWKDLQQQELEVHAKNESFRQCDGGSSCSKSLELCW